MIIFIDQTVQNDLKKYDKNIINLCGINIINIGSVAKLLHYAYGFLRFYVYYDFLNFYTGSVNRIILFDGMDTIFQGDPFYEDFPTDKLIVTVEDRLYKRTPWIKRNYIEFFKEINQTNNLNYMNFWVINSGLIGGSKKVIFTFLSLYKKRFDVNELIYQTQKMKYVDQAVLHALLLDGDLQKEGIDVVYHTIEDDYASITIGCWGLRCTKYRPNNYSLGYYRSPRTGNYPFMVHQFTRYPQIGLSISQSCPIDNIF